MPRAKVRCVFDESPTGSGADAVRIRSCRSGNLAAGGILGEAALDDALKADTKTPKGLGFRP